MMRHRADVRFGRNTAHLVRRCETMATLPVLRQRIQVLMM
jgi:hypothetical protein